MVSDWRTVRRVPRPLPPTNNKTLPAALGLYVHIPFCERKCPYCDFNTYAGLENHFDATVDALCAEMARWRAQLAGQEVTTVFVGGGTPTVLSERHLRQLLGAIHQNFALATDCEITSEANPGTVDRAKFTLLRRLGVNRISLGVQSFQPEELGFLGRIHDVEDVRRAFEAARAAGFDNINLDFMFGLPGQGEAAWQDTLRQALTLRPEHLSLYSLIVEPDTPLHHWVQIGRVGEPDEDVAARHYELARETLSQAGYRQYEVSNWALDANGSASGLMPPLACRHNLIYWRNQTYLGIGPGAHSHLHREDAAGVTSERRWGNHRPVPGYVRRMNDDATVEAFSETIDPRLSMGETMMLGLRLIEEGVSFERFAARYDTSLADAFGDELTRLTEWGLLELTSERVRLTERGLMVGNQVFARFLPDS